MTDCHNRPARCARRAIEKHIINDLKGGINENTPISIDKLTSVTINQKSDLRFVRREKNQDVLKILEFFSPFDFLGNEERTVKQTFKYKANKYQSYAEEVTGNTKKMSRAHSITISSLGAVYKESMKCLKTILKCSDRDLAKLGTWLSNQAIIGSVKLWIECQKPMNTITLNFRK
jgi:hypothetical protein